MHLIKQNKPLFVIETDRNAEWCKAIACGHRCDDNGFQIGSQGFLSFPRERNLDTEAYDFLYAAAQGKGAEDGDQEINDTLAWVLGTYVGPGNRQKMLNLLGKTKNANSPTLNEYQRIEEHMNKLGESYIAPRSFVKIDAAAQTFATIDGCTPGQNDGGLKPELLATRISKPLQGAVFLPSKVRGYEQAYLVTGTWEEEWTYKVCGKTVPVPIQIGMDGLGGIMPLLTNNTDRGRQ